MSKKIKNNCQRSMCPITNTLDVIGDKWTLLIVRDMILFGKKQFKEFEDSREGISTNILADRLKKLEKHNVITKHAYQENPTRYEYLPTKIGKSLSPLLIEMVKWGGEHIEEAYSPTKKEIEDILGKSKA